MGFFDKLRDGLSRTKQQIVGRFEEIVQTADTPEQRTRPINVDTIEALEELLISADVGLGLADFRASERTFQLLTQVAGRAGRGDSPGEAIIQTLYPDHYSIRHACHQDYRAFFEEEIKYRTAMRYPPAVALVNVVVRGPSFRGALEAATDLARRVRTPAAAFRLLGPAPAPFVRLRGEHRSQFFLKGSARGPMRHAVVDALRNKPDLRRRVTIDVDPVSVL